MRAPKATLIAAFVCLISSFAIANAAHMGGTNIGGTNIGGTTSGTTGPTPGGTQGTHTQPTSTPHAPVTMVKIRTPGQCFRYCRGTLGASIGFCAVSCYR
jgi:hypothetical protein